MTKPRPNLVLLTLTTTMLLSSTIAVHRRMTPGPFNATAYNNFIDCIRIVSTKYSIMIEDGVIAVVPPEGEHIYEDSAEDDALGRCMDSACEVLNVAVHSDRGSEIGSAPTQTLENATASWAEANGAEGIVMVSASLHPFDYPSFSKD